MIILFILFRQPCDWFQTYKIVSYSTNKNMHIKCGKVDKIILNYSILN